MQVIASIHEMQATAVALRSRGALLGFVPTMGYLHEGHLRLVDLAREQADTVIVSIFVNPTQFAPHEDFDQYPRDEARDLELLQARGADIVFMPTRDELYPEGYSTFVVEEAISQGLESRTRPHFFRGVATVVAKLFNIVRPDVAVFGQKDAQQAAIIQRMVHDLHFPVDILVGPTVREEDGLAMSSRNAYLKGAAREQALGLVRALRAAQDAFRDGTTDAGELQAVMTRVLAEHQLEPDYAEVVDRTSLQPVTTATADATLLLIAAKCGGVRLIDNGPLT